MLKRHIITIKAGHTLLVPEISVYTAATVGWHSENVGMCPAFVVSGIHIVGRVPTFTFYNF